MPRAKLDAWLVAAGFATRNGDGALAVTRAGVEAASALRFE